MAKEKSDLNKCETGGGGCSFHNNREYQDADERMINYDDDAGYT